MARMEAWKRRISLILVLALLLTPVLRVSAETIPEAVETQAAEAEFQEQETPEELAVPEEPVIPEEPIVPGEPEVSEESAVPEEPVIPEEPIVPEEPVVPEEPEVSEESAVPEESVVPEEPEIPEEPVVPEESLEPEMTEEPEETEEPELMEDSEETVNAAMQAEQSETAAISIAEVLEMAAGETLITIEGTVVFAAGIQGVLQDETGGIRLSFGAAPDIAVGDLLRITGRRSGGFAVESFEKTGTGELPWLEATLEESREALRILVKGAVVGNASLSQNGYSCQMSGALPEGIAVGDRVDAWGVMLDGIFYMDQMELSEAPAPEPVPESDWNFYFGQLHAHTNLSDGQGTVEEAFAHARQVDNLDFFAVTEHSNSFDNADQGSLTADGAAISQEWAAGKAAAAAVTDETFVGIFGYEMTWQDDLAIGHINTFGTSGWLNREQPGMDTLEGYLDALAEVPGSVSQFNHPGAAYGDFYGFAEYDPLYDARVHLLEVGSEGSFRAYSMFTKALDEGWHLAPANNQNNHNGNWGDASQARTVVLARELTESAIYDAVRNYRVYATEDADLKMEYRLNDRIMGSILGETETLTADIFLEDGSGDPIGQVEVITDGGVVAASVTVPEASGVISMDVPAGGSYYYLRVTRDGVIAAVTAPVWVDKYEDLGIVSFAADEEKPLEGAETALTLTLFNYENLDFQVENVTFAAGEEILEQLVNPGSVSPVSQMTIPFAYTQETAGSVTITATVTGTIAGLARSYETEITLLYQAESALDLTVKDVRSGNLGEAYRIRGYVTAGTSNAYNTFPGSIYLQDDTGGIQITDFNQTGIQVGTPMEVEGILRSVGGNLTLAMTDYAVLEEDYYRYAPETMDHETAMNYSSKGGQVLQIEGHVISVTLTADKKGVTRFTIRDTMGDLATVIIEDGIGSGAYGTNELASEVKSGRCVRAIGLLHIDEYGQTVLRVRNCDEVVYVPPVKDPSNPRTGDWLAWLLHWF